MNTDQLTANGTALLRVTLGIAAISHGHLIGKRQLFCCKNH